MDSKESDRRAKLLKQIKNGRRTGAILWTRLFMLLLCAGAMVVMIQDASKGKMNFMLLACSVNFVFLFAISVMGLGLLDMNQRFNDLIELIGEEKLLDGG
jgi:hypothetical protein